MIDADKSIQIGIRTEYTESKHEFEVVSAAEVNDLCTNAVIERIRHRVGDAPCYLTFDIDCLDPCHAPGTGTPVVNGLSVNDVTVSDVGGNNVEVSVTYPYSGILGTAGQANYAASKAGVIAMTKTFAREYGARNITSNAIAPGYIITDMTEKLSLRNS